MNAKVPTTPKLPCWQQSHWPQSAQNWTQTELTKQNIRLNGELQPIKAWALGHVFRQATSSGDIFFKATAFLPLFSNEASLCAKLFKLFPQYHAEVLAYDAEQQWMLTASFGEAFIDTVPLSDWAKPFAAFADLQLSSAKHTHELESAGCIRRDIRFLSKQLCDIFQDKSITYRLPSDIDLTPDNLHQALARLDENIAALLAYQLPNTLVHSDLHIENIAPNTRANTNNEQFIFFDWSDACISHPFIDGTYLFRMEDSKDKHFVIDAYLAQWTQFGAMFELKQAWELAESVCYAHQAVSYAGMIQILSEKNNHDLIPAFENAFRRFLSKMMN